MHLVTAILIGLGMVVGEQHPASPCPSVFTYEGEYPERDRWYGHVTLSTDEPLEGIWLNIKLDRSAQILVSWMGDVTTMDNEAFGITSWSQKLRPNVPLSSRFMVKFQTSRGSPHLRTIRLNGKQICPPDPNFPSAVVPSRESVPDRRSTHRPDPAFTNEWANRPVVSTTLNYEDSHQNANKKPTTVRYNNNNEDDHYPSQTAKPAVGVTKRTTTSSYDNFGGSYNSEENRPPKTGSGHNEEGPDEDIGFAPSNSHNSVPQRESVRTTTDQYNSHETYNEPKPTTRRTVPKSTTRRASNGNSYENPTNNHQTYVNGNKPVPKRTTPMYYEATQNPVRETEQPNSKKPNYNTQPQPNKKKPSNEYSFNGDLGEEECGTVQTFPTPLVTKGQKTARGQWPWHIALYSVGGIDLSYKCGGSLITKAAVITAAHCVTKKESGRQVNPDEFVVYLGKYHQHQFSDDGGVQNKQVRAIHIAPEYNHSNYAGDLAILILSSAVEYTMYVRPVCLWDPHNTALEAVEGQQGTVVGWGFDETDQISQELKMARMPVVSDSECLRSASFYQKFTSDKTFCAGFRNGTSVCNGDSGGGMVFFKNSRWCLRGLVSISQRRKTVDLCDASQFVVFTDVAKYLNWIQQIIS